MTGDHVLTEIGNTYPIGAQVRYAPPGRQTELFLVKSMPWRAGETIYIKITGFSEGIPVDELVLDMAPEEPN